MYYKCVDIAQMLIVYEDEMALEEAEAVPKSEAFPSVPSFGLDASHETSGGTSV